MGVSRVPGDHRRPPSRFIVKISGPAFVACTVLSLAGCSGRSDEAQAARPTPAASTPAVSDTATAHAGNERGPVAPKVTGGTDACARWLSSNPTLKRYLARPVPAPEVDARAASQSPKPGSAPNLDSEERLAVAFHRVLLAFVARDAPALAAALPDRGQLTVVNTMEDLVGTRELPPLIKELRARKGKQFENMMAGEDDDYADRLSVRATRPWCRNGGDFFVLGDDPSDVTFLRFSEGASPKLVAFGTAGL
jgi:hypothetical protein